MSLRFAIATLRTEGAPGLGAGVVARNRVPELGDDTFLCFGLGANRPRPESTFLGQCRNIMRPRTSLSGATFRRIRPPLTATKPAALKAEAVVKGHFSGRMPPVAPLR